MDIERFLFKNSAGVPLPPPPIGIPCPSAAKRAKWSHQADSSESSPLESNQNPVNYTPMEVVTGSFPPSFESYRVKRARHTHHRYTHTPPASFASLFSPKDLLWPAPPSGVR